MRRALLLAMMLGGLSMVPAQAQIPVTDAGNLIAQAKNLAQFLKSYATQLQQLQQEAQTAIATYNTLQSLVQNPNLGTATVLMGQLGLENPLPINPYAVQELVSGHTGITGIPGALSSLINTQIGTNRVYSCTSGTWACDQSLASARGIAGSQGIGQDLLQQLGGHVPILAALRDNLATATTPAQRENAIAAIQTEQAWTANAMGQVQSVMLLASLERDNRVQRETEELDKSIDGELATARSLGLIP